MGCINNYTYYYSSLYEYSLGPSERIFLLIKTILRIIKLITMFKLFPGRRAESMESLLSLSDVELGMEEHAGDTEDVDYHKRKIKRRVSVVRVRKMDYCICTWRLQ